MDTIETEALKVTVREYRGPDLEDFHQPMYYNRIHGRNKLYDTCVVIECPKKYIIIVTSKENIRAQNQNYGHYCFQYSNGEHLSFEKLLFMGKFNAQGQVLEDFLIISECGADTLASYERVATGYFFNIYKDGRNKDLEPYLGKILA